MRTPDHPLDELLTAYQDGEASTSERAQVEAALASDPEVAERHRRLVAVASLLEPPVPAPPDVVDAQIARALAATVIDLDAARRSRRQPAVFAAAAAIAVVFLVGTLLATRGGSDDAELADGSSVQTAEAAPGAVLEAETASAAVTEADGTLNTEPADPRDAGQATEALESEDVVAAAPDAALAEAVRGLLTADDPSPVPPDAGCGEVTTTVAELVGPVERSGAVTVDGVPLVLYVGPERVAVVDRTCAVRVVVRPEG